MCETATGRCSTFRNVNDSMITAPWALSVHSIIEDCRVCRVLPLSRMSCVAALLVAVVLSGRVTSYTGLSIVEREDRRRKYKLKRHNILIPDTPPPRRACASTAPRPEVQ